MVPFIVSLSHTRRRSFVIGCLSRKSFAEVKHENTIFRSSSSRVWAVAIAWIWRVNQGYGFKRVMVHLQGFWFDSNLGSAEATLTQNRRPDEMAANAKLFDD